MNTPAFEPLQVFQLSIYIGLPLLLLLLEAHWPRRAAEGGWRHKLRNLILIAGSTLMLKVLVPLGAVGFAALWSWGLLHHLAWPNWLELTFSLVILDVAIYWQHRFFHLIPWLWRAHRVHHSDTVFDVSLGVRFHPFEILPSFAYKLAVIAILGPSGLAVAIYEALLLGFALFTHANLAVPLWLDRRLRWIFVTPDWHRVHHDVHGPETNSNFGNILSIWDRVFGTAIEQPRVGHLDMKIGLTEFRDPEAQSLPALLIQPFASASPSVAGVPKDIDHA